MKKKLLFGIITLCYLMADAQKDTLSIDLSAFTKKRGTAEVLYVAVFIKSNIPERIEIDDSKEQINCINASGVKLIQQRGEDNYYREIDRSDCLPLSEDYFKQATKSKTLEGKEEYSYIIEVMPVAIAEVTGLKRSLKDFNSYRFKLELPFRLGNTWYKAASRNWLYYAYSR